MEDFSVDFICVGAARSGTTWLYECLREHPSICISQPKELHFFSSEAIFTTSNAILGPRWYQDRFAHWHAGQLRGEISPSYLVDDEAPAKIAEAFPRCRLIFLFRDPIDALYSLYLHGSCCYDLGKSFEEFVATNHFVRMYEYDRLVQNYLKHFSREQMLFLPFADIVRTPKEVLNRICTFLDTPTISPSCMHERINPHQVCRSRLLRATLEKTKAKLDTYPALQKLYKKTGLQTVGIALSKMNRQATAQKSPIDASTKKRLEEHYSGHNEALQKHTGIVFH